MVESEKIRGTGITRLFKELLQRRTLLRLRLANTDFKHLTLVTHLKRKESESYFIIDIPEGFKAAAADIDIWQIHFEFTGNDNINYVFTTTGGHIEGNQIYIKLPEEVERKQRRKLFRINAPIETKLCFSLDATRHELDVLDISLGGSLAALVQTDSRAQQKPAFTDSDTLKDIELVFPAEISRQPIKIKTAQIKRVKKNPETTHYEMGLEFNEISKDDERLLNDLIYRLQRQHLRKRLPLDI
ncbi:MAG: PilZ domain-containing protein [Desulfobacterales bacterium]|jgi:c-di-GMP-binding flagellar brake protein YcgR